jgi:hypothetical protein
VRATVESHGGSDIPPVVIGNATGVRLLLTNEDGEVAEVQVSEVGRELAVAVAGTWGHHTTQHGVLIVNVAPLRREAKPGGTFG